MEKNTEIKGEGENNGWIKIESEADLPKEKGNYFVNWNGRVQIVYWFENPIPENHQIEDWLNAATHYQPISKPLPPKF